MEQSQSVDSTGGSEAVRQILSASSLFARLGLPDAVVEIHVLKKHYRRLALAVHPDKCRHASAKEAFQKLSEAFDSLANEEAQRKLLSERHAGQDKAGSRRRHHEQEAKGSGEARWWDTKTWEEFERRFRHRDAAEAALLTEFESGVKAKHSLRQIRNQVLSAEKSAEHCDRAAGLRNSALWRPRGASEERPELAQPSAALARLLDLLTHLRTVHRYCLYCGCVFDSFEDLERSCPGFTEEEHDRAPSTSAGAEASGNPAAGSDQGQILPREQDPLDAFMAGMQAQLNDDMRNSELARRRRHMPQKGWSFEQQAQQNKNEHKRLKRGR